MIIDNEENIRRIMAVTLKAAKNRPSSGDTCVARRRKSYVTRTLKMDKINACRHFQSPG
jgi:hypothetical protein